MITRRVRRGKPFPTVDPGIRAQGRSRTARIECPANVEISAPRAKSLARPEKQLGKEKILVALAEQLLTTEDGTARAFNFSVFFITSF